MNAEELVEDSQEEKEPVNKKKQLLSFLNKYYLDGAIDKTVIEYNNGTLRTQGFNTEQQLYCDITMRDTDIFGSENVKLTVTNTSSLFRMLKAFKDPSVEIHFNEKNANNRHPHSIKFSEDNVDSNFLLSREGVVMPHGKDINPDINGLFEFEVDEKFYDKFNNYKYLLKDETKSFSFFERNNSIHILFGLNRYVGSNNVAIDLELTPNVDFRDEVIFPIDAFDSIIKNNMGAFIKVKVLSNAMVVTVKDDDFDNIYAMASLKNKVKE